MLCCYQVPCDSKEVLIRLSRTAVKTSVSSRVITPLITNNAWVCFGNSLAKTRRHNIRSECIKLQTA